MEQEYLASAFLMIRGDDLDPERISAMLGIEPDQTWDRSEQRPWSGWKKYIPTELKGEELPMQLAYWAELLRPKSEILASFVSEGYELALGCFVTPRGKDGGTASMILTPELLGEISALGLEMQLSFQS